MGKFSEERGREEDIRSRIARSKAPFIENRNLLEY